MTPLPEKLAGPVLVAVDGSPGSVVALGRGRLAAAALGRDLVVCHVADQDSPADVEELWAELADGAPEADLVLRDGVPSVEIARLAGERSAIVIVLGVSDGGTGAVPLGVTSGHVVERADRPVLLARLPARADYRTVIAGVDGSPESMGALSLARAISPGARIVATRVVDLLGERKLTWAGADDEEVVPFRKTLLEVADDELEAELGAVDVERLVVEGPPAPALERTSLGHDADLLAVGWRGSNRLRHALLGGVAHSLVQTVSTDMLIYRSPGEDSYDL